jgi:hypothetical protein
MRMFRRSIVVAAAIASLTGGAELVGCGGDDASPSTPPGTDATTDAATDDAGTVTTGPVLTVSTVRAKLYLGQTAKIDGAAVAPGITTDIAWSSVAAPFGSAITLASLQGATTATPSFKPDLLGQYTFQISGRKDGATTSVLVFIEAVDAPVFWREAHVVGSGEVLTTATLATHVSGIYGGGDRQVSCSASTLPDGGASAASLLQPALDAARLTANGGDVWEAPPGSPSRVVYADVAPVVGGGTSLWVVTSQSTCGSSDAKMIEAFPLGADLSSVSFVGSARFSPSGNRVAYLHDVGGKARLAAVGIDGSAKRDLAPFYGTGASGGGLDPDAGSPLPGATLPLGQLPPRWKDETHVGWITFVGPDAQTADRALWELYLVEDAAGASAKRVMHCSTSSPTSWDFLPDGSIVVAARHASPAGGGETTKDLLVYRANAATGECEIVRNLTNNTESLAVARDLALSPDKSQIAFFSGNGTGFPLEEGTTSLGLLIVPADGSHAAVPVPGAGGGANPGVGPRWAAGATALTWGGSTAGRSYEGKQLSIPVAGGVPRVVSASALVATFADDGGLSNIDYRIQYGIGQGCGVGRGPLSTGFAAAGGALALVALVARRRRRAI